MLTTPTPSHASVGVGVSVGGQWGVCVPGRGSSAHRGPRAQNRQRGPRISICWTQAPFQARFVGTQLGTWSVWTRCAIGKGVGPARG